MANGKFVVKTADGGYRASAGGAGAAEPFRMQATALGRYLLYGAKQDFMAVGKPPPVSVPAPAPGTPLPVPGLPVAALRRRRRPRAERARAERGRQLARGRRRRRVRRRAPAAGGQVLAVDGAGTLVLRDAAPRGPPRFAFVSRGGCPEYPESEVDVSGDAYEGSSPVGRGRAAWSTRTSTGWPSSSSAAAPLRPARGTRTAWPRRWSTARTTSPAAPVRRLENVLSTATRRAATTPSAGRRSRTGRDVADPRAELLQVGRARAARRAAVLVNLLVDNAVLCEIYPLKQNWCDEMDAVRLQARRTRELEDYIDAQNGGPGKGWFRIVDRPVRGPARDQRGQARGRPGDRGLPAVRLRPRHGAPSATAQQIDRRLDEVCDLGVRDLELVNKFDNALSGVAGDPAPPGS